MPDDARERPAADGDAPATGAAAVVVPAALVAWVLLGQALALFNGAYTPRAARAALLALAAVAVAAGALAVTRRVPLRVDAGHVAAAVLAGVGGAVVHASGIYGAGNGLEVAHDLPVVAALLGAVAAWAGGGRRGWAASLGIAAFAAAAAGMIRASPAPRIDVWVITQQASDALLAGRDPWAQCWVASTDRATDCVYPYLPATLLLQAPFKALFGDVRWSLLAALVVSAVAVWRIAGPRLGPPLAVLLLLQPKLLFLLEQAWTEPLLLACLSLLVLAVVSGRAWWGVLPLALALAGKQHVVLLLPLAAAWPAFGWRRSAAAAGAAYAVALPFMAWAGQGFVDDAVRFHLDLPARPDSLSAYWYLLPQLPGDRGAWVALVAGAALVAALLLARRGSTGFVLGAALLLLAFGLVNKQTFFNHHSLPLWLLVVAVACAAREASGGEVDRAHGVGADGRDDAGQDVGGDGAVDGERHEGVPAL